MSGNKTFTKLIDCGLQLFLDHGFTASGISRIVGAAGVPKGSFYHFFPGGKEAFALAVIERYHAGAAQARRDQLLAPDGAPLARLRQHFTGFAYGFRQSGFRQGCLLGNLSAEVADQIPTVRAALQRAFSAWVSDVATVIAEAQAAGTIGADHQPELLARSMVAAWEGALLMMKSHKSATPLDDFERLWFDRILISSYAPPGTIPGTSL